MCSLGATLRRLSSLASLRGRGRTVPPSPLLRPAACTSVCGVMDLSVSGESDRKALTLAMRLSLVIGVVMFVLKVGAYLLTGSAAILSDAAESVVHVAAVIFAAYSLRLSYRPTRRTRTATPRSPSSPPASKGR